MNTELEAEEFEVQVPVLLRNEVVYGSSEERDREQSPVSDLIWDKVPTTLEKDIRFAAYELISMRIYIYRRCN